MCEKEKWHPEAKSQGVWARLIGHPLSSNFYPTGWLHDSFEAGWREVDNDPDAPKRELGR